MGAKMPDIPRNPLSCIRCKQKKIKCGKEEPKCDKCSAILADCAYPVRRKRNRSAKKRADVLSQILARLDALERKAGVHPPRSQIVENGASIQQRDGDSSGDEDEDMTDSDEDTPENGTVTRAESETPFKSLYQLMDEAASTTKNALRSTPEDSTPNNEPDAIFSRALTSIKNFRWKDDKNDDPASDLDIPCAVAQRWVQLCFQIKFFEELVGAELRSLMTAMPSMMDTPVVQLPDSLRVVYYSVLFFGWRRDEKSALPEWNEYGRMFYRKCLKILPGWKNDGKPENIMDFTATGLMSIMAIENFDYHLGWDLHFDCCTLARVLKLDQLDAKNPNNRPKGYEDEGKRNVLRKKIWQLIHMEFFFRLYYDRPPTMTGADFSVNLPMLPIPESANHSDSVYFLVSSRNVFITKEFFDILQKPDEDLRQRVEDLSDQIEQVMEEWKLANLLADSGEDQSNAWVYGDLLISGYITIILMERKAFGSGTKNEPPSSRSVRAARKALETIHDSSTMSSQRSPNIMGFISFYPFVAFFTLYHHILSIIQQKEKIGKVIFEEIERDVGLMESLGGLLLNLAAFQEEFGLIFKAVDALTKASRYMVSASVPNTPVSISHSPPENRNLRSQRQKMSNQVGTEGTNVPGESYFDEAGQAQPRWPSLEAGLQRNDLEMPWQCVESMESDLFGKNWHQAWWDQ